MGSKVKPKAFQLQNIREAGGADIGRNVRGRLTPLHRFLQLLSLVRRHPQTLPEFPRQWALLEA